MRFTTDTRIKEIKNTGNLTIPSGAVVYYVANDGSDTNDGRSDQAPFKTIEKVNSVLSRYGSGNQTAVYVCFKRGDVWRGERLDACDNLTVTAYGTGAKPVIMGSPENGGGSANASKWVEVEPNIWRYEGSQNWGDVGNIVFNDGEGYAKKIIQLYVKNSGSSSYRITDYTNGNGQQYVFNSYTDLKNDLDFYHDKDFDGGSGATGYLYIYSTINPALRFESIEFAPHVNLLYIRGTAGNDKIVIDNICFKYSGGHAISAQGVDTDSVTDFTVQNCEFGWIGGSIQTRIKASVIGTEDVVYDVRYGNAIEIYGACDGFTVKNNYIYQVFDAGITVQKTMSSGDGDYSQKNVLWTQNVIENCNYSVEYFLTKIPNGNDSIMSNFQITDNLMWNSGTGFCETRGVWDRGFSAHIKCQFSSPCNKADNFVISGNTMVGISGSFIQIRNSYGVDSMPLFENNTLYGYYDFEGEADQGYRIGEVRVTSDGEQIWTPYDTNIDAYLAENMGSKYGEDNKYYFIF